MLDCPLHGRIRTRRLASELDFRQVDFDVGFESGLVNGFVVWREVSHVGEPETALVGQLDQALARGASQCVDSNEIGAIVLCKRCGEYLGGTRSA